MQKQFIITVVITFVVIMIWVAADIFHTQADKPVSSKLQQVIAPITPTFDEAVLEEIGNRQRVQSQTSPSLQITPSPTNIPPEEITSPQ